MYTIYENVVYRVLEKYTIHIRYTLRLFVVYEYIYHWGAHVQYVLCMML